MWNLTIQCSNVLKWKWDLILSFGFYKDLFKNKKPLLNKETNLMLSHTMISKRKKNTLLSYKSIFRHFYVQWKVANIAAFVECTILQIIYRLYKEFLTNTTNTLSLL